MAVVWTLLGAVGCSMCDCGVKGESYWHELLLALAALTALYSPFQFVITCLYDLFCLEGSLSVLPKIPRRMVIMAFSLPMVSIVHSTARSFQQAFDKYLLKERKCVNMDDFRMLKAPSRMGKIP